MKNPVKQSEPVPASNFTKVVKDLIKRIPQGKVCTYGIIAAAAGSPRAAQQVAWILHSSSKKDSLPWHRVVNRRGKISLKPRQGRELQKQLLELEGIAFDFNEKIAFDMYLWVPEE